MDMISTTNSITSLRALTGMIPGDIYYIKGHTNFGDGGQGLFIYKNLSTQPQFHDNDGTIVRASNSVIGGWVRIIEDTINVNFFGAFGTGTPSIDDGARIQKAIDYAYNNQFYYGEQKASQTVFIPTGQYYIHDKLVLKSGVNILGDNTFTSVLISYNVIKKDGALIEMDSGEVWNVSVSNLNILGNANPDDATVTKWGMYFLARLGSVTQAGGLWFANFKNIKISGFNGHGMVLLGSGSEHQNQIGDYNFPNQDCIFENVNISRQHQDSCCLLIKGMAGQLTFINSGFDGTRYSYIGSTFSVLKYFNVAIETLAVQAAVIKFITCTFQYSEYGAYMKYAETVTFDNCWFEYLDTAIAAMKTSLTPSNASQSINILNSRFANASGFGSLWSKVNNRNGHPDAAGNCIYSDGSNINVHNNYVLVTDPASININNLFIRSYNIDAKINASGNSFQHPLLSRTYGIANKISSVDSGNFIDTSFFRFITINSSATVIEEIISDLSAGETLTVRCAGTGSITFDNTKNILLTKPGPLILNDTEIATFIKIDTPVIAGSIVTHIYTWQLISVNKV